MVERIVLAVDGGRVYEPALTLLSNLGLRAGRTDVVHVVEIGYGLPGLPSTHGLWTAIRASEDQGKQVLDGARAAIDALGFSSEGVLLHGRSGTKIVEYAEAVGATLVVVGSEAKGRWGALFFGSVTRELSIHSRASFLVGKTPVGGTTPGHAVFAMDHSDFAHTSADELLKWAPTGLKKVTFVTAFTTDVSALDFAVHDIGVTSREIAQAINQMVQHKSDALVAKYKAAGIEAEYVIDEGDPREIVAEEMTRTGSELLILGARGHSFAERLTLGSISMHFVVSSPFSTLVIRPR